MLAALEPDPPIAERFIRFDVERRAHLGGRRFVDVIHTFGDNARRVGQAVIGAPALERQRGAVVTQQIGVEVFDQRQRFEPPDKAVWPGRGLGGQRAR